MLKLPVTDVLIDEPESFPAKLSSETTTDTELGSITISGAVFTHVALLEAAVAPGSTAVAVAVTVRSPLKSSPTDSINPFTVTTPVSESTVIEFVNPPLFKEIFQVVIPFSVPKFSAPDKDVPSGVVTVNSVMLSE